MDTHLRSGYKYFMQHACTKISMKIVRENETRNRAIVGDNAIPRNHTFLMPSRF